MMSKSRVSIILLLLCASLMPLTILQLGSVSGKGDRGGGGRGGGGGGGMGGGGGLPPGFGGGGVPPPNINVPTARPTINIPTARPTVSQPIASFTRPSVSISFTHTIGTSFSFTRSEWTGITFTRTQITSFTFNPTFTYGTSTVYYPTYGGFDFYQYPPNYNSNVGSFTLDQTLTGQNDVPCVYYTYFEFNAYAGQQFVGRVWTTGATINYIIVPTSMLTYLQQMGCGYSSGSHQGQSFSSQITVNWTAAQTDQYAIIFYSLTPYTGPVYFLPGP